MHCGNCSCQRFLMPSECCYVKIDIVDRWSRGLGKPLDLCRQSPQVDWSVDWSVMKDWLMRLRLRSRVDWSVPILDWSDRSCLIEPVKSSYPVKYCAWRDDIFALERCHSTDRVPILDWSVDWSDGWLVCKFASSYPWLGCELWRTGLLGLSQFMQTAYPCLDATLVWVPSLVVARRIEFLSCEVFARRIEFLFLTGLLTGLVSRSYPWLDWSAGPILDWLVGRLFVGLNQIAGSVHLWCQCQVMELFVQTCWLVCEFLSLTGLRSFFCLNLSSVRHVDAHGYVFL